MKYNPSVNDWMIRIAHLEAALSSCSKNVKVRPGVVEAALRAEIEELSSRVGHFAEKAFRDPNREWRL